MAYQPGQPGNLSNLPNSSSWGLPTNWDFTQSGVPAGLLSVMVIVVIILFAMHLMKPRRRR